jgi:hypothetical protein
MVCKGLTLYAFIVKCTSSQLSISDIWVVVQMRNTQVREEQLLQQYQHKQFIHVHLYPLLMLPIKGLYWLSKTLRMCYKLLIIHHFGRFITWYCSKRIVYAKYWSVLWYKTRTSCQHAILWLWRGGKPTCTIWFLAFFTSSTYSYGSATLVEYVQQLISVFLMSYFKMCMMFISCNLFIFFVELQHLRHLSSQGQTSKASSRMSVSNK